AMLVVILGTSVHPPLEAFVHLWWYATVMVLLSGLVCLALPGRRPARSTTAAVTDVTPAPADSSKRVRR
ncbi:MAG TPA: hypothetical protein VGZ33_07560, partial [Acidimicrobiales bacterium]|nr:hypothetical protein [Acidimicrobiales bacterium]